MALPIPLDAPVTTATRPDRSSAPRSEAITWGMMSGKLPGVTPPTREPARVPLLISVRDPGEALAALAGGADIIDVKEPSRGALGSVEPAQLVAIRRAVPLNRSVTAALGDLPGLPALEELLADVRPGELALGKIGLAGDMAPAAAAVRLSRAARLLESRGVGGLVVVAYADWLGAHAPPPAEALSLAQLAGAAGVLLDTASKDAGSLLMLWSATELVAFAAKVHAAGLFLALGGGLSSADLPQALAVGADVIGVRGAACAGGARQGRVEMLRVRALRQAMDALAPQPGAGASSHSAAPASSRGPAVRQSTPAGNAFRK
jgi:uncharacterized protein (UPF0264 family)